MTPSGRSPMEHGEPERDAGDVQVVVFDLGGVLVRLGGIEQMIELCGGIGETELWERWLTCRWVRAFERGRCSTDEFASGVVADWQLPVSPAVFLASFERWPRGLEPDAAQLVAQVRERVQVACLSNTNPLHWARQRADGYGLDAMFDRRFLSHELGMVKPDGQVFEHVAAALAVTPSRVLFLDDNQRNVDAARLAGWSAQRVRGTAEARDALVHHGVLA